MISSIEMHGDLSQKWSGHFYHKVREYFAGHGLGSMAIHLAQFQYTVDLKVDNFNDSAHQITPLTKKSCFVHGKVKMPIRP